MPIYTYGFQILFAHGLIPAALLHLSAATGYCTVAPVFPRFSPPSPSHRGCRCIQLSSLQPRHHQCFDPVSPLSSRPAYFAACRNFAKPGPGDPIYLPALRFTAAHTRGFQVTVELLRIPVDRRRAFSSCASAPAVSRSLLLEGQPADEQYCRKR